MLILILGIIGFCVFVGLGWWVSQYNFFKSTIEAIKTQWSNIVTEFERRVDLFLNLSKSVKSFTKHERDTFSQIAKLRSGGFGNNKVEQMKNMAKVESLLGGLNLNVEAYPELKADVLHAGLMGSIEETEDRINVAKTGYNEVIREFNTCVETFPSNIVANVYRFVTQPYYETNRSEVGSKAPEVML